MIVDWGLCNYKYTIIYSYKVLFISYREVEWRTYVGQKSLMKKSFRVNKHKRPPHSEKACFWVDQSSDWKKDYVFVHLQLSPPNIRIFYNTICFLREFFMPKWGLRKLFERILKNGKSERFRSYTRFTKASIEIISGF